LLERYQLQDGSEVFGCKKNASLDGIAIRED